MMDQKVRTALNRLLTPPPVAPTGNARRILVDDPQIPTFGKGSNMKNVALSFALFALLAPCTRAGVVLSTSDPVGTPLTMSAGTTSGTMLVNVVSDNPPNDIMAAWNLQLEIVPNSGATGSLMFQDPATGTPPTPPNYIFGSNGLGIAVTNAGSMLSANDFFNPSAGPGMSVPGAPGANLLQMDFLASSNASGSFGIFAVEGAASTQWTDSNFNTQLFTNVPDGTAMVQIGEVLISQVQVQSVPEPSSFALLGMAGAVLAGWRCWSKRTS
jgi:PEP-CTERM motif